MDDLMAELKAAHAALWEHWDENGNLLTSVEELERSRDRVVRVIDRMLSEQIIAFEDDMKRASVPAEHYGPLLNELRDHIASSRQQLVLEWPEIADEIGKGD